MFEQVCTSLAASLIATLVAFASPVADAGPIAGPGIDPLTNPGSGPGFGFVPTAEQADLLCGDLWYYVWYSIPETDSERFYWDTVGNEWFIISSVDSNGYLSARAYPKDDRYAVGYDPDPDTMLSAVLTEERYDDLVYCQMPYYHPGHVIEDEEGPDWESSGYRGN